MEILKITKRDDKYIIDFDSLNFYAVLIITMTIIRINIILLR